MKYFSISFSLCCILFIGIMAGIQFAEGNIVKGVIDIGLALVNFPCVLITATN